MVIIDKNKNKKNIKLIYQYNRIIVCILKQTSKLKINTIQQNKTNPIIKYHEFYEYAKKRKDIDSISTLYERNAFPMATYE